jgi:hypothetical protein
MIDEGQAEDTEGNMPFRKVDAGDESGDTEGNMPFKRGAVSDGEPAEDSEGNGLKFRGVGDGAADDAEGNVAKAGRATRPGRAAKAGRSESDDTEGNAIRSGRAAPNDARPNRAVKPRG